MIKTYPLCSMTVEQATEFQFRAVDCITREFHGTEILALGDLGLASQYSKPSYTRKAEKVLSRLFDTEDALLVRGAGTGALRFGILSMLNAGESILIHRAPIYPTTKTTLESASIKVISANFNDKNDIQSVLSQHKETIKAVLVQMTRQAIDDCYDTQQVLSLMKQINPDIPILTDDNYAAFKVPHIGCQLGADLSSFSFFKVLGPEGIGVLLGKKALIHRAQSFQYSGGSQVQGFEAMEILRSMIYAPVSLAISAKVSEELVTRLSNQEVKGVKQVFLANAQSKVVLVEFEQNIAQDVLEHCVKFGAAPHPVGCESKYEFVPLFYRVSGTFLASDSSLSQRMIRINPLRSGADTVIRILNQTISSIEHII